jgi:hypothetical protein
MPVAIIGAYQYDKAGRRIATLPVAGMALAERQARAAASADASPILLLGEGDDAALADIVGRLARDGIDAHAIDGLPAAAEQIPLDMPVLLIADGCLADVLLLERVGDAHLPALATIADGEGKERYERIDADARWAGVALLDGTRIGETAAMLGSWDPVSTLLRRAVQENAVRLDVGQAPPMLARDTDDIDAVEDALHDSTMRAPRDWIERFILLPIERLALPYLLDRRVEPNLLADIASVAAIAGAACALYGWRWPALIILLAVAPLAGIAERLGRIQGRPIGRGLVHPIARLGAGGVAVAGLALLLALASQQWGWLLLPAILVGSLLLLEDEKGATPPLWLARPITLPWALLPFAAVGRWGTGLAALALWGVGSFVTMLLRRRRAGAG